MFTTQLISMEELGGQRIWDDIMTSALHDITDLGDESDRQ